jgi:hypothetical protein
MTFVMCNPWKKTFTLVTLTHLNVLSLSQIKPSLINLP